MLGKSTLCTHQPECIPVGCVPPAAIAFFPATHAPLPRMSPHHTCPLPPPCMSTQPCTSPLAMHAPCHTCPPPDRILDTRLWKYYLAATSLRVVIMYTPSSGLGVKNCKSTHRLCDVERSLGEVDRHECYPCVRWSLTVHCFPVNFSPGSLCWCDKREVIANYLQCLNLR